MTCCVYFRQTEEINQALEDNQVKLSTMKASRFVKAFEHEVDKWERALSLIMEIIEMLLTVQRQWMYLEVCVYCVCVADGPATVDVHRDVCVLCLCCCAFNMTGTLVTCNNQSRRVEHIR